MQPPYAIGLWCVKNKNFVDQRVLFLRVSKNLLTAVGLPRIRYLLTYPAPPRFAALPCAAPTRPARGVSGFWIGQVWLRTIIPRHALHEKSSQRQKSVGPLVSSLERRALLLLMTNRLSTGDFVPALGLHFCIFVLLGGRSSDVSSMFWKGKMKLVP